MKRIAVLVFRLRRALCLAALAATMAAAMAGRVEAAANGSWKTGSYYGNIADGFTDIAPFGPKVSAKTKALIAAERKKSGAAPSSP